jgi:hypothetical protein
LLDFYPGAPAIAFSWDVKNDIHSSHGSPFSEEPEVTLIMVSEAEEVDNRYRNRLENPVNLRFEEGWWPMGEKGYRDAVKTPFKLRPRDFPSIIMPFQSSDTAGAIE